MKKSLLLLSAIVLLVCVPASGQKAWKKKVKEKRFEPVVKEDIRGYAGRYVGVEDSHWLDVSADAEGRLTATVYEEGRAVPLRDLRLDGARLTATKIYDDGRTAPFASTFADRILNGERAFGILVEGSVKLPDGGGVAERLFYRLR